MPKFVEKAGDVRTPFFKGLFAPEAAPYTMAEIRETVDWCEEHFGSMDGDEAVWVRSGAWFGFRDVDAAFAFKMRWC